jgi:hypothetical protein
MEKILWSIALPGFGQILNGRLIKGFVFVFLEFLINVQADFNQAIMLSFHGDIESAIEQTNYLWLMFYPCLYTFAMWDAFKEDGGGEKPYSFLPFVFGAYFGTIGVIYSPHFRLFGILLGPLWLSLLSLILGFSIGFLLKWILYRYTTARVL